MTKHQRATKRDHHPDQVVIGFQDDQACPVTLLARRELFPRQRERRVHPARHPEDLLIPIRCAIAVAHEKRGAFNVIRQMIYPLTLSLSLTSKSRACEEWSKEMLGRGARGRRDADKRGRDYETNKVGTGGRIRTDTVLPPGDFESPA